ncbi:MAG: efflux RND transporter permease subunit [Planctomycetota bacterium]
MRGNRSVFSLFLDRPILTLMATLTLLLVGVISFTKIPLRFVPEGLSDNRINIYVPVGQDRSPIEVEEKIVEPFEEQLRTIPGLREIESEAGSGYAQFEVQIDPEMDLSLAAAEVRDRAQRAKLRWPEDANRYFTWREDASSAPLAFFQMLTPARSPEWDLLIDKVIQPRLERVEGVGRLEFWGMLDETVRIWFDHDKLVAHRIDFGRLLNRLARDNFAEPIGEIDDGRHRYLARVVSKFTDLQEIESYPIRTGLVIGDIAKVERVPSVRNSLSRFNQKYTYTGMVRAAAGVNPVDASRNLREAMDELGRDPRLASMECRFLFDQGEMIADSLNTLVTTSLQGGALALLALFLFLRNFRFTLAIAMAIPLALLIVGGWLFFTGDSLNVLTMAGMTLAVGMVVDNSVVVLENIRRLRQSGLPLRDACLEGAREVGLAVVMATLTTVVVIMPMVFIGSGQARVLLGSVGTPLSVALIGSLAVALLLLPSGLLHLGGVPAEESTATPSHLGRLASRLSPVGALLAINQRLLRLALRHRVIASIAALSLLATCQLPWERMEVASGDGGPFRRGDISIYLKMPRGLGLADVEREVLAYEDFVLERAEEWRIDSVSSRFDRDSAALDIALDREVPIGEFTDIRAAVEAAWPQRAGVEVKLSNAGGGGMGGGGSSNSEKSERNFVLRIYGRDSQHLLHLGAEAREAIRRLPQVDKVEIPSVDDNVEVAVRLDRDRLQDLEVAPDLLRGSLVAGLQGRQVTELEERGRETRVIAEFDRETNPTLVDLKESLVFSGRQVFQRLASLADVRFEPAMGSVTRIDGRTNVTIVGRRAEGVGATALSKELQRVMQTFPLPRGYSWREESTFMSNQEQMFELMDALLLGVIFVFLLMGVLFESVILPFSIILFLVPFSILGALWALYLFVGEIEPMAFVGMILLAGIIVNNGIVLLDCIARLRPELGRETAILEGTRRRLRPIIMTATTTIVGLLPMAIFGESGNGLSYVSMSIAVSGGLALCTIFTAFVVPLTYTLMDDFAQWLRAVWQRALA